VSFFISTTFLYISFSDAINSDRVGGLPIKSWKVFNCEKKIKKIEKLKTLLPTSKNSWILSAQANKQKKYIYEQFEIVKQRKWQTRCHKRFINLLSLPVANDGSNIGVLSYRYNYNAIVCFFIFILLSIYELRWSIENK
jgi:hypothetical protein